MVYIHFYKLPRSPAGPLEPTLKHHLIIPPAYLRPPENLTNCKVIRTSGGVFTFHKDFRWGFRHRDLKKKEILLWNYLKEMTTIVISRYLFKISQDILVPVWSEDSIQELKGCFECTDWELFKSVCTDLDDLTETVTNYIVFCEDLVIKKKLRIVFPNNKPWITKHVKNAVNLRNIYYKQGDSIRYREAHKLVRNEVRLAKLRYKEKVENMFISGESHLAWDGVKSIIGTKQKTKSITLSGKSDHELADDFNLFYTRFDIHDFTSELSKYGGNIVTSDTAVKFQISEADVRSCFGQVKVRKSPGPNHISGRLLRNCAEQLSGIY